MKFLNIAERADLQSSHLRKKKMSTYVQDGWYLRLLWRSFHNKLTHHLTLLCSFSNTVFCAQFYIRKAGVGQTEGRDTRN